MKYTKEQRLNIGRRIYSGEISKYKAAEIYDIVMRHFMFSAYRKITAN